MKKLIPCPICGMLFNREETDVAMKDKDGKTILFDKVKCANEYMKEVKKP